MSVLPTSSTFQTTIRRMFDSMVDAVGETVSLYKVDSEAEADDLGDVKTVTYAAPVDVPCVIDWEPERKVLKALSIHVDDGEKAPILARFRFEDNVRQQDVIKVNKATATDVDTISAGDHYLEVVDRKMSSKSSVELLSVYLLAPRRAPM